MNGNGACVSFGTGAGNFGTNDFTIDFWMQAAGSGQQAVLSKRPVCNLGSWWDIEIDALGRLVVNLCQDNNGTYFSGFYSQNYFRNDTAFHHVVVQRMGVNLTLYVDGNYDNSDTTTGVVNIQNTTQMFAGKTACTGVDGTGYFNGVLDEIQVSLGAAGPVIVSGPTAQHVTYGQQATFSVSVSGSGPAYQWYTNNMPVSGATGSSWTLTPDVSLSGCQVTVACACNGNTVTSPAATLTVDQAPLTVVADDQTKHLGDSYPIPTLTGNIYYVLNNDNITATYSTTATVDSPPGPYDLVPTLEPVPVERSVAELGRDRRGFDLKPRESARRRQKGHL